MKELLEKLLKEYKYGDYYREGYSLGLFYFVNTSIAFSESEFIAFQSYFEKMCQEEHSIPSTVDLVYYNGLTREEAVQKRIDWLENHIKTL